MHKQFHLNTIESAIDQLKKGGLIVVVDDEDRENEGDLICSAANITPEQVNFMAKYGRGLICLALPPEQVARLNLPMMLPDGGTGDNFGTAFTLSIDAREGITTGISAADRALTIRLACDPKTTPEQMTIPGHVFPLKAKPGGVLQRRGHTEAAVDLTRLAGLESGGAICEIMKEDGTMMRLAELIDYAKRHKLPIISIEDLVKYRQIYDFTHDAQSVIPTSYGTFNLRVYKDDQGLEHLLLWLGNVQGALTRIHSECLTGDVFGSNRCDCGPQLEKSMQLIAKEGNGIIMYLRQEGRGIGLTEKIKAYALQDNGLDTVEANIALGHQDDCRTYGIAVEMLKDLDVSSIRLLTNNPRKINSLTQAGIKVETIPLLAEITKHNQNYQQTKVQKMGHLIPLNVKPFIQEISHAC